MNLSTSDLEAGALRKLARLARVKSEQGPSSDSSISLCSLPAVRARVPTRGSLFNDAAVALEAVTSPVHYVVEGEVQAEEMGDVGEVGVTGLRSDAALGVRLFPSKLSMENGFNLFLSSLPFTERSMLPLWTSSSLAACLMRFLAPLPLGWRPAPTSSRRRSSKLKPQ